MDNIANQATLLYNNMTTNSNTVTTQILSLYDLTATKEALLDTYTPNQTITYVTRVENTGSASLYNLTVVDDLAKGLTQYVDNSVEGYLNGTPIEVNVQTTTPTTRPDVLTNTQTITANGGSTTGPIVAVTPNPSASVKLANYVSLDITKSANKASIYSGDTLVYTFQIINNGNETATNVSFSDVFPTGYTINSISLTTPDSPTPIIYDPTTYVTGTTLTIPNLAIPVGTSTLTVSGIYTN